MDPGGFNGVEQIDLAGWPASEIGQDQFRRRDPGQRYPGYPGQGYSVQGTSAGQGTVPGARTRQPRADGQGTAGLAFFLAGPENRLAAHAVAGFWDALSDAVPVGTGEPWCPLMLCGPPGVGKSHLARGLWRRFCHAGTGTGALGIATGGIATRGRAECVTGAEFASGFADAVDDGALAAFQTRFREADFLVLEDVWQLAGRTSAQTELVQTWDALTARNAAVIVTSRTLPHLMPQITPALTSRFSAALVVSLAPPGSQARQQLVSELVRQQRWSIQEEALTLLREQLQGTAADIQGALLHLEMTILAAVARAQPQPAVNQNAVNQNAAVQNATPERIYSAGPEINAAQVRAWLAARPKPAQPSLRGIAARCARHFSLSVTDLKSSSRRRAVVLARGVAMYLCRQLTDSSLEQIGRFFGGRDHTTVIHGCRQTEGRVQADPFTRQTIQNLKQALGAAEQWSG